MLNRFCFMNLNTAGLVIGWIGAIGSLIPGILFSIALGNVDALAEWIVNGTNSDNPAFDVETLASDLTIVFVINLVAVLINLITSALLVYGTMKKRHLLLMPWLIECGLALLFNIGYIAFFLIVQATLSVPFGSLLLWFAISAVSLLIQFYIWYAIYSLYMDLKANRDQYQQLINSNDPFRPLYSEA